MLLKIKNYISDNTGILIRIDDIAENMNWDLMEKSELLFEKYRVNQFWELFLKMKITNFYLVQKKMIFGKK